MEDVARTDPVLDRPAPPPRRPPGRLVLLVAAIAVQVACALFFLGDVVMDIAWADADGDDDTALHNAVETAAAVGLAIGVGFLWLELRRMLARQAEMAERLQIASGAFHALMEARFDDWHLTPAERDVAMLLIKGLSLAEIAALRQSAEGTVKAHCNKVYHKAGVAGRAQLVSLFLEDLMSAPLSPHA